MALDLTDKSGNGHTLSNSGATDYTASLPFSDAGANTDAVQLSSAGSANLSLATPTFLNGVGAATFESWINPIDFIGQDAFMIAADVTVSFGWVYFRIANTGKLSSYLMFSDNTEVLANGSLVLGTGAWTHVALTFDGTQIGNANIVKYYVNGSADSLTFSGTAKTNLGTLGTSNFNMGHDIANSSYCNIFLDETRLWTVARTQTDISNNMNKQLAGTETGLAAYWPYNALAGTVTKRFQHLPLLGIG